MSQNINQNIGHGAGKTSISQWKRNWVAYVTITRREILRFSRIWIQTLVPPVVMTGLYFVIFGN
ncbi:MAG: hypothetical protein ACI9KM_001768, partial [Rubritalea sp.]